MSRHINLLEHTLGVRLFDRSNRSVRLTSAGQRFLFDAIDILTRAEAAMLFARQTERGESGTVMLGFVPSATIEVVPCLVLHQLKALPGVQLKLREMMSYEQVEALLAGSLDIGITRLPHRRPALELRRVWSEPFVLVLHRSHPLVDKPEVTINDLNGVDFIGFSTERGGFLHEVVTGYLNSVGVTPNTVYSVAQSHTVMSLVNANLGVGLVPRSCHAICMPQSVIREIALPETLRSDLYMALGAKDANPLVSRLAALIEEALSSD